MERSKAKAWVAAAEQGLKERHASYGKGLREKRTERELGDLRGSVALGELELRKAREALKNSTPD